MKVGVSMLLLGLAALGGCDSPETVRTRGGGPGADVGNRPADVKMHEGSNQYWRTPDRIALEHPPLEPAGHARRISQQ
jgi:hypothetical protein